MTKTIIDGVVVLFILGILWMCFGHIPDEIIGKWWRRRKKRKERESRRT